MTPDGRLVEERPAGPARPHAPRPGLAAQEAEGPDLASEALRRRRASARHRAVPKMPMMPGISLLQVASVKPATLGHIQEAPVGFPGMAPPAARRVRSPPGLSLASKFLRPRVPLWCEPARGNGNLGSLVVLRTEPRTGGQVVVARGTPGTPGVAAEEPAAQPPPDALENRCGDCPSGCREGVGAVGHAHCACLPHVCPARSRVGSSAETAATPGAGGV